jgi:oxygen-independent coproporphyrinogen-3 oxidase
MISSLYIHIPFCDRICNYCDFCKVLKGTFSEELYIKALIKEIDSLNIKKNSLKTIYIGGGTPTALSDNLFKELLSYLNKRFYHPKEFTVEANPESLTKKKVSLMLKYGVNRVSLGVQSSNDERLRFLGRNHQVKDVIKAVGLLRKNMLLNYNLDFIYGVPGMQKSDVVKDVNFAIMLKPTHLSFYSLQIEDGTVFKNNKIEAESDLKMSETYNLIRGLLSKRGYHRYEVSNFALKGYESIHNLNYWHDGMYYAAGVSASGYIGNIRYTNTRSIYNYCKGINHQIINKIEPKDEEFEFLMLNLRLQKGFKLTDFYSRFNKNFLTSYKDQIAKVKDDVLIDSKSFKIKPNKIYIMDAILLDLLK